MIDCAICETMRQVIQASNELKLTKKDIVDIVLTHDNKYALIFEK